MTDLLSPQTIEDVVRVLLAEMPQLRTAADRLTVTDDLYAAGLSSLATVDLMLAIEDRFDIEFSSAWLNRRTFATIGALGNAVRQMQEQVP